MKALIILLLFLTTAAYGKPKVIMLTSLIENENYSQKLNKKTQTELEEEFREAFQDSSFDVVVSHRVAPDILWDTLNDSSVIALFWVSHARGSSFLAPGMREPERIVDAFGNDVKDLFKKTTSSLRYLSIIGCEAEEIIKRYQQEGRFHSQVKVMGFNKKIKALSGLRKSLKESFPVLHKSQEADEILAPTTEVKNLITFFPKSLSLETALLKIEAGNELLSVVKYSGGILTLATNAAQKNIVITLMAGNELPVFSISEESGSFWKLFEKDHRPIGYNRHLYIYQKADLKIY